MSVAEAEYFLTCATDNRQAGLATPALATSILQTANVLADSGVWRLRTAVIMPDHVHLLLTLGKSDDLPAAMRRFKGCTVPLLRSAGLRWQRGYFDHRLRTGEDRYPIFHYIYLNPYRSGLIRTDQKWIGYFCVDDDWSWFRELTANACPHPEWLL